MSPKCIRNLLHIEAVSEHRKIREGKPNIFDYVEIIIKTGWSLYIYLIMRRCGVGIPFD